MNAFSPPQPLADADTRPPEPIVELRHVTRRFGTAPALDDVTLSVGRGQVLGLIGRSGAGKSTLIRCLNGLDKPESGQVLIAGQDITGLDERALQPVRRRIGMIFQHFNLLSAKTVAENVALPLKIAGRPAAERRARALDLLDLVGLADMGGRYPAQLSGGQKQRVGIARALAADPILLLSDEATSALDPETTQSILDLLRRVNRDLGLTILLITHEMEVVRQIADRVAVLDAGRIVEEGPVARVLASPRAEKTWRLVQHLTPALPPDLAALLARGEGTQTLLRVDLVGAPARSPVDRLVAETARAPARLVHGGISDVQGEPYARLFLVLGTTDPAALAAVERRLAGLATAWEVLGLVPADV